MNNTLPDRCAAALLLANGLALLVLGDAAHPLRVTLGALCVVAAYPVWLARGYGHVAALLCYALQATSYYSIASGWWLRPNWVVSAAAVVYLPDGIMLVNVLAVLLVALHAVLLGRRYRAARRAPLRSAR